MAVPAPASFARPPSKRRSAGSPRRNRAEGIVFAHKTERGAKAKLAMLAAGKRLEWRTSTRRYWVEKCSAPSSCPRLGATTDRDRNEELLPSPVQSGQAEPALFHDINHLPGTRIHEHTTIVDDSVLVIASQPDLGRDWVDGDTGRKSVSDDHVFSDTD